MPTKSLSSVKHTIYLSTNIGKACEHCSEDLHFPTVSYMDISGTINHYIEKHGYRLLHIGQETGRDDKDRPCESTVAIVGK